MPTDRKRNDFADMINDDLLDLQVKPTALQTCIEWINDNLSPDEVYGDDKLRKYVSKSSLPEDVFDEKELQSWAEENGYIRQ